MLLGDFTWSQQHIILNQSVSAMLRNKELHQTLVSIRIGFGGSGVLVARRSGSADTLWAANLLACFSDTN